MKLMHFSSAETIQPHTVAVKETGYKPTGLWVSDEDEYGWSSWCESEQYGLGGNAFTVQLADNANVLTLSTVQSIRDFNAEYATPDGYFIDWLLVAARWEGILITPYQWELRFACDVSWYYPWDCASGCIWAASAIASVTQVPTPAVSLNLS